MGDFTKKGEKIGTCGNAYYATKEMIQNEFNKGDHSADIKYYLDPDQSIRYAFPFPEYDNKKIGEISNFHEGQRTEFTFKFVGESAHGKITTHLHPKGGPGINIFTPCPYTEGSDASSNLNKDEQIFRLTNQIQQDGKMYIGAECIYCKTISLFSADEAIQICETLSREAKYYNTQAGNKYETESQRAQYLEKSIYIMKVANRILETYPDRMLMQLQKTTKTY